MGIQTAVVGVAGPTLKHIWKTMLVVVRQMREINHVEDINFQRELETLFFQTSLTANIKFFLNIMLNNY